MKRKSLKKSLRKRSVKLSRKSLTRKNVRNRKLRSKKSLKRSRRKIYDGVLSVDDKKFIEWCKKITNDYHLIFISKYNNEVSKDKKLSKLDKLDLFPSFEDENEKNIVIIRKNYDLIKKYIDIISLLKEKNSSYEGPEEEDYAKQFNAIVKDFDVNFIKTLDTICKPLDNLIENHFNIVDVI